MALLLALLSAGWVSGFLTLCLVCVGSGGLPQRWSTRVLFAACAVVWVLIAVVGMQVLLA